MTKRVMSFLERVVDYDNAHVNSQVAQARRISLEKRFHQLGRVSRKQSDLHGQPTALRPVKRSNMRPSMHRLLMLYCNERFSSQGDRFISTGP